MQYGVFLASLLIVFGCTRMDPDPHLRDPIYSDINSDFSKAKKDVDDAQKEFDVAASDVQNIEPQTGQYKLKWKAYFDAEKKLQIAKQKAQFLEIHLVSREKTAKKEYRRAFAEGREWPVPAEYAAYKKNKELIGASRDWNTRVPRLRGPADIQKPKAEAQAASH